MQALGPENVVAEVDFTNAFNSVELSVKANGINEYFPMLSTWFSFTYGRHTNLLVRDRPPISSERGVQQGDPLGPFFFALALQPVLEKAAEDGCCVLAYLDDV